MDMKFDDLLSEQGKERKAPSHPEHDLQVACVTWFNLQFPQYRGLLFAVPNGAHLSGNTVQRHLSGLRLRQEGMVAGVSDLLLLVAGEHYHGLCIEMKAKRGVQSPNQKDWQARVEGQGYKYVITRSLDEFMEKIKKYLERCDLRA